MRIGNAVSFRKSTQTAYGTVVDLTNNQKLENISIYDYWSPDSVQYRKATESTPASIVKVDEGGSGTL